METLVDSQIYTILAYSCHILAVVNRINESTLALHYMKCCLMRVFRFCFVRQNQFGPISIRWYISLSVSFRVMRDPVTPAFLFLRRFRRRLCRPGPGKPPRTTGGCVVSQSLVRRARTGDPQDRRTLNLSDEHPDRGPGQW